MVDYAIGDVHGCYEPLLRLLDQIKFDDRSDRLWFVGDLVNRGPQSLQVLRFIKNLPVPAIITLGNHDLYLLVKLFTNLTYKDGDHTLKAVLQAEDAMELGHWLRAQHILYHDATLNVVMSHAGIAPIWNLTAAKARAQEVKNVLSGNDYAAFLHNLEGNQPAQWSADLTGYARLRLIANYFTRMRFCDEEGNLNFNYKGTITDAPEHLHPWFAMPGRMAIKSDIVFGHWAALAGKNGVDHIHALDTGCVWGGSLTAIRLTDKQRFTVPGL